MATILHISDLHRTPDEDISNAEILHALAADVERYAAEGIKRPDIVIVSGDLAQSAEPAEYDEARGVLEALLDRLKLSRDRVIIVPGNHDVHWPTSEVSFVLRRQRDAAVSRDLTIEHHGEHLCALSEAHYQQRLDNFRRFHEQITGVPYPIAREQQYAVREFPELRCAVAAFSSCDLNDHRRFGGRIHPATINAAADTLEKFDGLRIAVWHHDLNWRAASPAVDFLSADSLRQLSLRVFHLGLCGHTHRPASNNVCTIAGLPLPVISAGSICAGPRQRGDSVPRAYNVLELGTASAKVHVRVREDRASPWIGIPRYKDSQGNHRSYYTVDYANHAGEPAAATEEPMLATSLRATDATIPTPFAAINAKTMSRSDVATQYVWTDIAFRLDSDTPQIVLGPRGSGKTALLLSLTLDGRLRTRRGRLAGVLRRLGLMCPLNVPEVSAFNGKGWLPRAQRQTLFRALLATFWAQELIEALSEADSVARDAELAAPTVEEILQLAKSLWFVDTPLSSIGDLQVWIKRFRTRLVSALSIRGANARAKELAEIAKYSLGRGGPGALVDFVGELRRWPAYSDTRWTILFDEAEYLNEWQQQAVYAYLGHSSERVTTKIATLPYAHSAALRDGELRLFRGNDYSELPITLGQDSDVEDAPPPTDFTIIAKGVWAARLERSGVEFKTLEEVWPEPSYEEVSGHVLGLGKNPRAELEERLLELFAPGTRTRAEELRSAKRAAFLDRYWRRYQQPFRFRLAHGSAEMPLYWGWRTMLRACDGNCRWFLQIADECWRLYWMRDGLRALTPTEQYFALQQWAESLFRVCGNITDKGDELKGIIERVTEGLRVRIYAARFLKEEALSVELTALAPKQAEAVAVGVAFGFLVPRLPAGVEAPSGYPTTSVELRLGFPVAVTKKLPLRTGATLKIKNLRQVVFPWLRD